jgi:hypothetical protein
LLGWWGHREPGPMCDLGLEVWRPGGVEQAGAHVVRRKGAIPYVCLGLDLGCCLRLGGWLFARAALCGYRRGCWVRIRG